MPHDRARTLQAAILSDGDKSQIEAEERAKLAALRDQMAETARQKALEEYRESVDVTSRFNVYLKN